MTNKTSDIVLLTGGTGMLGNAFLRRITGESGLRVRMVSRRAAPSPKGGESVIGPSLEAARLADWRPIVQGVGTVVHTAAITPWTAANRGAAAFRPNVHGTASLAQAAAEAGVRRFVFVSSLGVHGIVSETAFRPEDAPSPSGYYARSKLAAEEQLRRLCAGHSMELVILRPPIVYGPGVGGKIGALVRTVRNGRLTPLGAIRENSRQMIGVDNLADAIALALRAQAASGRILLPADDEAVSTGRLLEMMAEAYDMPLRTVPVPRRVFALISYLPFAGGLAQRAIGNVRVQDDHLRGTLNWVPPLTLAQGIARMVSRTTQ